MKRISKEKIAEIVGNCKEWFEIPNKIAQAQLEFNKEEVKALKQKLIAMINEALT